MRLRSRLYQLQGARTFRESFGKSVQIWLAVFHLHNFVPALGATEPGGTKEQLPGHLEHRGNPVQRKVRLRADGQEEAVRGQIGRRVCIQRQVGDPDGF